MPRDCHRGCCRWSRCCSIDEDLTDRQAAAMAVRAIDWKYVLGAEVTDTGFDAGVLSRFRTRLTGHGMEGVVFDRLLGHCKDGGLVAETGASSAPIPPM
ncbi:transposase [Streptomyces avermitilis]|uniref:transposase n=1 Tax=Streptomyces avermitilis TaxID=33903 RepID=UPI0033A52455